MTGDADVQLYRHLILAEADDVNDAGVDVNIHNFHHQYANSICNQTVNPVCLPLISAYIVTSSMMSFSLEIATSNGKISRSIGINVQLCIR